MSWKTLDDTCACIFTHMPCYIFLTKDPNKHKLEIPRGTHRMSSFGARAIAVLILAKHSFSWSQTPGSQRYIFSHFQKKRAWGFFSLSLCAQCTRRAPTKQLTRVLGQHISHGCTSAGQGHAHRMTALMRIACLLLIFFFITLRITSSVF
jgi:hypothetical protein